MSTPKEPSFFAAEFRRGIPYYQQRYFRHWKQERFVGEASHRNLYLPYVAERIHQVNPAAQLVVMLRNPVERAYSHWWHYYSRGRESLSFADAIRSNARRITAGIVPHSESVYVAGRHEDRGGWNRGTYLDSGYYFEQLNRYRDLFPGSQLKVILLEDLESHPYSVIRGLHEFLGCRTISRLTFRLRRRNRQTRRTPAWLARLDTRWRAPSRLPPAVYATIRRGCQVRRRPAMDEETRMFLVDHFADHNRRLGEWLCRDLSHWV
jgi:hypothetical protein